MIKYIIFLSFLLLSTGCHQKNRTNRNGVYDIGYKEIRWGSSINESYKMIKSNYSNVSISDPIWGNTTELEIKAKKEIENIGEFEFRFHFQDSLFNKIDVVFPTTLSHTSLRNEMSNIYGEPIQEERNREIENVIDSIAIWKNDFITIKLSKEKYTGFPTLGEFPAILTISYNIISHKTDLRIQKDIHQEELEKKEYSDSLKKMRKEIL